MPTPPDPTIVPATTPTDWADGAYLVGEHLRWLDEQTPLDIRATQPDAARDQADPMATFAGPGRALLVARVGRLPAGIVGIRPCPHESGSAELVRFFVRPVARSNGIGRALVARAITEARRAGYGRIALETMPSHMAAAVRIYEAAGFALEPSGSLHGIPGAVRYGMTLVRPRVAAG